MSLLVRCQPGLRVHQSLHPLWPLSSRHRWKSSVAPLDLQAIDVKWQKLWNDPSRWRKQSPSPNGKYYVLPMFPYPSGSLHIGHLRVYTISDVIARYRRMNGHDVLHPIGWDAFGLPAENAAIERGINPAKWTVDNIEKMREQIKTMGGCWDWDVELQTCDPSFYGETQKLFIELYNAGLVYQAEAEVNYDPIDKTVLANEQVDSNGFSWRSGAKVEKRSMKQWFLRISAFRDALLEDLKLLEDSNRWPQNVINMQRHWLGKSTGADVDFEVSWTTSNGEDKRMEVTVFTTRPDTLLGVQYLAVSMQHPLVQAYLDSGKDTGNKLRQFLDEQAQVKTDNGKPGFMLEGVTAANPVYSTSAFRTSSTVPLTVWVAPYVLDGYGSGAVMGVPAHDVRDSAFFQQNVAKIRGDEPHVVITPAEHHQSSIEDTFTGSGVLNKNCGPFANMTSEDGGKAIVEQLGEVRKGRPKSSWRLRDWLISRQRYWGTPIPIIHCGTCGAVPAPEESLPVRLPVLADAEFKDLKSNPLEKAPSWKQTSCPRCERKGALRETDTMDTFVDSSWYYFQFARSAKALSVARAGEGKAPEYTPVDAYVGGIEHAILHLLYSRFISKFVTSKDTAVEKDNSMRGEPFLKLITQGMVHGPTYTDPDTLRILKPNEVDLSNPSNPLVKRTGKRARIAYEKMSKSKYNGVDPAECMRKYSADVTRSHLLFSAPVADVLDWDEQKIVGVQRWFGRIWQMVQQLAAAEACKLDSAGRDMAEICQENKEVRHLWLSVQTTIASVKESFEETYALNTIVSDLMKLTNGVHEHTSALHEGAEDREPLLASYRATSALLRMLAPIAPSFAEECWETLHAPLVEHPYAFECGFPSPDGTLSQLASVSQRCVVQVNGKVKCTVDMEKPSEQLGAAELKEWLVSRVSASSEWAAVAAKRGWQIAEADRVVVAKSGQVLNLVFK